MALARSLARASWASTVFSAGNMLNAVGSTPGQSAAGLGQGLDAMSAAVEPRLDTWARMGFQAGEALAREWIDLTSDALTVTGWRRAGSRLAEHSTAAMDFTWPSAPGKARRQELLNKIETCRSVYGASAELGLPHSHIDLSSVIQRIESTAHVHSQWYLEGVAYEYFRRTLIRDDDSEPWHRELAPELLPILSVGLGLAVAERVLGRSRGTLDREGARRVLDEHLALCHQHSAPGRLAVTLEGLGLLARCLRPRDLGALNRAVELRSADNPELPVLFAHGVGRGLYFVPIPSLSIYGSLGDALAQADLSPTAPRATISGLVFAFVSVNLSSPATVEALLYAHRAELDRQLFQAACVAALHMRRCLPGGECVVERFLKHGARRADFWRTWVVEPMKQGVEDPDGLYAFLDAEAP